MKGVRVMRVSHARLSGRILLIVVMALLSGCLGNRDWKYPPSTSGAYLDAKADLVIPAHAIVLPLEDLRSRAVKEEYWKAAIPLVPHGDTMYDRPEDVASPEEVDVVRFDPQQDFARAIAAEISNAGIYSSVTYVQDEQKKPAEVVFRGRLRSTEWKRRLYTYFVGPLGTVFWILGLPMSETTTALTLELRLTPVNDPSQVLWNMTMDFEGKQLDSPYYGLEAAVESYQVALQEAMRPAIEDLVGLSKQDASRLMPR